MDEYLLRLGLAMLAGAAIGAEREFRNKAAGFRTMILISTSAAMFSLVGSEVSAINGTDPSRISAQVVSGIGFLGAGVIIKDGFSVSGLTSAATIWASAAVGMTLGFGYFETGMVSAGGILTVLWVLPYLEHGIDALNETRTYTVTFESGHVQRDHMLAVLADSGLKTLRKHEGKSGLHWTLTATLAGRHERHECLVRALLDDADVIELS